MQQKEISKADMKKKVEAWQTICRVTQQGQDAYMRRLDELLAENEAERLALLDKIEKNEATTEEGTRFVYLGGYTDCLRELLKKAEK